VVSRAPDGSWQVAITGSQGSGILRSMSEANGLVVLGHQQGDVAEGEPVEVLPFDGLV
jgi:molybdopterin molybdotransferase